MKKIVTILTGLMLIFYGCTTQTTNKPEDKEIKIKQPTKHYLSENDMQDYINDEINLAIDMGNEFILKDAANALNDTRNVMEAIRNKNYREARERLTQAMGKTKLLLAGSNTKALASITVEINQGVKNVNEAYQLINEIDSLVSNKEYQKARNLMPLLSNEILITRESLLINKFDEVLKRADQVFRAKEYEKAFQELNGLTTTTSFEYTVIPLPVIKAEKMIAEAAILLNKEEIEYNNIEILLDNAMYEIEFTELLGYGKQETDFKTLIKKIENLKKSVSEKNDAVLKEDMKDLNESITQTKEGFTEVESK